MAGFEGDGGGTIQHPEKNSSPQLRRLCLGDVKASGGSVLLVPVITSVYRRLGKACDRRVRGGAENGELEVVTRAPAEARGNQLYVIN